ncbi:hypothetical protein B0H66DRAFT_469290 [Apodospora peruviana]|uniref:DUF726-domain-containing protein n=1 Tax=Apodospora peruviana TaxID=516989 RepID=A0AAE0MG12_9PEZI|nr:hypothetical protein B0H66DRAFT_469290 [Apodospora peruviana]
MAVETPELDDFGLPVRKYTAPQRVDTAVISESPAIRKASRSISAATTSKRVEVESRTPTKADDRESDSDQEFKDAVTGSSEDDRVESPHTPVPPTASTTETVVVSEAKARPEGPETDAQRPDTKAETKQERKDQPQASGSEEKPEQTAIKKEDQAIAVTKQDPQSAIGHSRETSTASVSDAPGLGISEFSHQQLTAEKPGKEDEDDGDWQEMPAYARYDIYDDDNRLIAKEHVEAEDESYGYAGLGGAGKGYTRVYLDDDVESATSMDENTNYLFKEKATTAVADEDETQRDAVGQLQATKELLTEGQRIAYVGLTRLELSAMVTEAENLERTRRTKKELNIAAENMKMWSQKMMIRLYAHMDINPAEQIMIEQLSSHGVLPQDLTPVLMVNARVKNPMAEETETASSSPGAMSPRPASEHTPETEQVAEPPPPYDANDNTELTAPVRMPSQMETTQKIDIDLRWTVLCDLFLVLIADSVYDARSRVLLERVAKDLEIPWIDICRFEKKVTDALEMQQNAEKENWNEDEHMESRRKMDLRRRYVFMGLATVGGGLVIGLSAGLLAPLIGAGLVAGFTTIGVGGTSGFLAGAGGAAVITSSAAASGGIIGVRAANRRTGSVKTFEYRPLHNNKRVNLIVTVSGWMTGKVDDVRLPYSTVDPIMGDIYSVLWEPEMLTSMGDTINILATEALTQGLQQVLGSTILVGLMAALQLPVVLTKLSYLIDNPWTVSLDRAVMAGLILADSLIDRNLGTRPVTLVGYSLGSRVIFACLQELAKKGAYGLVQNVFMFGSPIVVKHDEYLRARSVVSGRFVNGYNRNDWILGYLFRLTNGGIRRVAGLAAIEGIPGLENMDVAEYVVGHMGYRTAMPRLLRECGWMVESDEFTEIEDPDPEKHQERQRELINEIEEARKEFEKEGKGSKGAFSFFRKKKALEKQEWEVYEDSNKAGGGAASGGKTEDKDGNNHGVLFDVDAIRAELAKEHQKKGSGAIEEEMLQVREIKSTLPPMKLDLSPGLPPPARTSRDGLRETRSVSVGAVPQRSPAQGHETWGSSHSREPSRTHRLSAKPAQTFPVSKTPEKSSSPLYQGYGGVNQNGRFDDDNNDNEIQMTFDTAFESSPKGLPPPPPPPPPKDLGNSNNNGGSATEPPPARPEIKSSQTVPNIMLSDPWADVGDDDDDEFGKEKEISMTFA